MNKRKREIRKEGVTISIAAEVLGVSLNTLRAWDKNGTLRANKAKNGYRYYHISDLEKFKTENGIDRERKKMVLKEKNKE